MRGRANAVQRPGSAASVGLLAFTLLLGCGGGGGGGAGEPTTATSPPPSAGSPPPDSSAIRIRVLGIASDSLDALFTDVAFELQHQINTANDILTANQVDVELVMDYIERVDYPDGYSAETALEHVTFGNHPAFAQVAAIRAARRADLVVLFRPYAGDGQCGFAWIGGYGKNGDFSDPAEADFGYSVVAANCSDYSLLHEVGHNLGLAHSRREDPAGGSYAWGTGFGSDNDFVTIMASPAAFNGTRLPRLSSPDTLCNSSPCGVARTESDGADARTALQRSAGAVADYQP